MAAVSRMPKFIRANEERPKSYFADEYCLFSLTEAFNDPTVVGSYNSLDPIIIVTCTRRGMVDGFSNTFMNIRIEGSGCLERGSRLAL